MPSCERHLKKAPEHMECNAKIAQMDILNGPYVPTFSRHKYSGSYEIFCQFTIYRHYTEESLWVQDWNIPHMIDPVG